MRRVLILGASVLVGLFIIFMQRSRQHDSSAPSTLAEQDQPAPPFQLKDLEGNEVTLSEFQGKVVMLDFWATWCGPCRMTMPGLEKLHQAHANDFVLLAVNVGETPDLVIPYIKKQNIQARVLLDLNTQVAAAYQAASIPMQVVIDQKGILRHIQMGYYPGWDDDLWAAVAKLL